MERAGCYRIECLVQFLAPHSGEVSRYSRFPNDLKVESVIHRIRLQLEKSSLRLEEGEERIVAELVKRHESTEVRFCVRINTRGSQISVTVLGSGYVEEGEQNLRLSFEKTFGGERELEVFENTAEFEFDLPYRGEDLQKQVRQALGRLIREEDMSSEVRSELISTLMKAITEGKLGHQSVCIKNYEGNHMICLKDGKEIRHFTFHPCEGGSVCELCEVLPKNTVSVREHIIEVLTKKLPENTNPGVFGEVVEKILFGWERSKRSEVYLRVPCASSTRTVTVTGGSIQFTFDYTESGSIRNRQTIS